MIILPELCISFYFLLAYCTLVTYVYILFVSLPDIHSFHFIKIKKIGWRRAVCPFYGSCPLLECDEGKCNRHKKELTKRNKEYLRRFHFTS